MIARILICYYVLVLQAPLPKLPVPELSRTLSKYLDTMEAVMRVEDFERMRSIVQKFGAEGGEGEKLQEMLKEFAENQDCWVSERNRSVPLYFQ